jgi:hypothetical protein
VWGTSNSNVWFVAPAMGNTYHYNGISVTPTKLNFFLTGNPTIWGSSASDLWIVGGKGAILHSE